MRVLKPIYWLSMLWAALAAWSPAAEGPGAKVEEATAVLEEIMAIPEQSIPPSLLADAQAVAIIPNVIKVGFVLGGRFGQGVVVVRRPNGGWSDPVFLTLAGGSVGWQIGAQATDVILVFKNRRGLDSLVNGKVTLGGDVAVAAGPVGRNAAAATDLQLRSEIYSYSRSRGLFAGVALDGSVLDIDKAANAAYYGEEGISASAIFEGKARRHPEEAGRLRDVLARHAKKHG